MEKILDRLDELTSELWEDDFKAARGRIVPRSEWQGGMDLVDRLYVIHWR